VFRYTICRIVKVYRTKVTQTHTQFFLTGFIFWSYPGSGQFPKRKPSGIIEVGFHRPDAFPVA